MQQASSLVMSIGVLVLLTWVIVYAAVRPTVSYDQAAAQYSVIFGVGTTYQQAYGRVIKAGGIPMRPGTFDFVIIAASADHDFSKKIKKQGAYFVFSPIIKGGCFIENKTPFKKI